MNTIAIDCGASFIKGALFEDNTIVNRVILSSPKVNQGNDVFRINQIEDIINNAVKMLDILSENIEKARVCISNEMHGFILTDVSGQPYTDYISWQKELGSIEIDGLSSVKRLYSEESLDEDIRRSGMPLRAGLPICNLFYLTRIKAIGRQVSFYTLGDYIVKRVLGIEPFIHPTNAAATGYYDLSKNDWNRKLIEFTTNGEVVFPRVGEQPTETVYRGKKFTVYPTIGDQQAALLGAGLKSGDLSFNLGTGAQVSCVSDTIQFSSEYQVRPFFEGRYINTIPHLPSGRAINVFINFIRDVLSAYNCHVSDDEIWKVILDQCSTGRKDCMVCDLGFFENNSNASVHGAITDIVEGELLLKNLFASVFSEAADNFMKAADKVLDRDSVKRIVFTGGIAKRVNYITDKIVAAYSQADTVKVVDETLTGLNKYAGINGKGWRDCD